MFIKLSISEYKLIFKSFLVHYFILQIKIHGIMEDCIKTLSTEIKCRDSLIGVLYSLLADDTMFQSIFIYGHISCGKSYITEKVLNYLNYNISVINCIEHTNNKSLFEKIIIDLASIKLTAANGYRLDKKCDDFVEFIRQIKLIADKNPKPIVILLEKCEKLREMDANVLPALLRLQELTKTNICIICSSDIVWEKYQPKIGMYEPIMVYFPQYTKDEVSTILRYWKESDYDDNFYKTYLSLFLSVFFRFCRDLKELRYMAMKNFSKYVEPIENDKVNPNDTTTLWRRIVSTFKANLEVIYLRVSATDFEKQDQLYREIESKTKLALSFDLPYYAKYLLVAAYLASYNPPVEDKRLFMKAGGPRKKRAYKKRKEKLQQQILEGPKAFPLSRLLAIFCSINDHPVDLNAILLSQVPSMCQLGLLSVVGDGNIDDPKYKCRIDFDFAMVISKNISFELKKYLYDFLQ